MSNTGGLELNGFQVNGNLSVLSSDCDGDGSVELSGTLYTDTLVKYTSTSSGISIEKNIFNAGQIYVPSTLPATSMSSASLVVDGGISVARNSKFYGSLSVCSGGSLIISGDQFLQQNLYIGKNGIIYLNNSTPSYSVSSGSFISVGGVSIQSTTDATSYSSGGALTIAGGLAVGKTLYASEIVSDSFTTENIFATNASFGNAFISDATIFQENVYQSDIQLLSATVGNIDIFEATTGSIVSLTAGTLNVSGNVYLDGGIVTNVTAPSNPLDVANKYYVDRRFAEFTTGNVFGNFTSGEVIVAGSTGSVTGYADFTFDGTTLSISSTAGALGLGSSGALIVEGDTSLTKDTFIGGNVYLNGGIVTNVTAPSNPLDVANKYYVDHLLANFTTGNVYGDFTSGEVIIAGSTGSITGYADFTFDGMTLLIASTAAALGLGTSGALIVEGDTSLTKDTFIGGNIYLNGGIVTNVTAPSNPLDVANKYYVDHLLANFTTGNVYGNFTKGEVIVAGSSGSITGYSDFTFDGFTLKLASTAQATNTSTGSLVVDGGAAIQKDTFIGGNVYLNGGIVTNVTSPSNPLDVANKYYVDHQLANFTTGNVYGNFTRGEVIVGSTAGSLTGYSDFTFDGITLKLASTAQATSISTGSLVIDGGAAIKKDTFIGGNVYLNGGIITNVTAPSNPLDLANKYYVDSQLASLTAGTLKGNFTQGQIVIASTNGSVTGYPSFVFLNGGILLHSTSDAYSITSGGGFTNYGGLAVGKNAYFGQNIYLSGGIITNVTAPSNLLDVANKYYVDQRLANFTTGNIFGNFSSGEVIVAGSTGAITGYSNFMFDGTTLSILSTNQAIGLNSGGALNVSGGLSVAKNVYVGGKMYMNNTIITNVTSPSNPLDVANKYYVDQRLTNFTTGNVYGNFTRGQVIVAGTSGSITSYSNFLFDGKTLEILSTNPSTGLGSGGSLNVLGGASISGKVYTNGLDANDQKITSVALPTNPLDAVNKEYVDYFLGISTGDIREMGFTLANAVLSPAQITNFRFDSAITSSFEGLVYLKNDSLDIYTQFELNGVYRSLDLTWQMSTRLVGDYNSGVVFSINPTGQIEYTNTTTVGTTVVYFRALTTGYGEFTNVTIGNINYNSGGNTLGFYTSGTLLLGNNSAAPLSNINLVYTSGSLMIGGTTPVINISSGGVLKVDGGAIIKQNLFVGTGIDANHYNITSVADPLYPYDAVNKRYIDYYLGISTGDIREMGFTLANAVTTPSPVTNFHFDHTITSSFEGLVYLKNDTLDIYTQFELNGVYRSLDSTWQMSTRLVGDYNSGVVFSIDPTGQIDYTNTTTVGTTVVYFRAMTTGYGEFTNMTMSNNQTGNTLGFYTSGTLLFGNGSEGPLSSAQLLYTSGMLMITGTTPAYNLSSGSVFKALGGVIIEENLLVANGIDANNQIISGVATPTEPYDAVNKSYVDYYLGISTGDIRETGFTLGNGVLTPSPVTAFVFDSAKTSSFEALVYLKNSVSEIFAQFELNGIYRDSFWQMSTRLVGDYNSGVNFTINSEGQIDYTNQSTTGTTVIYFRALTTGYSQFTNVTMPNIGTGSSLGFYTSGTVLFGNNSSAPLASSDFLFTNGTLVLSNTSPAISLTSGNPALSVAGGVVFKSNLIVAEGVDVSNQNITNVADPVQPLDAVNKEYVDYYLGISTGDLREMGFTLGNGVMTPLPVTNFKFDNSVTSSFEAIVYLKNDFLDIYTQFELNGIYRGVDNHFQMSTRLVGDYNSGVTFSIDPTGQIGYTNSVTAGTSIIYFRALTTGYSQFTNVTMPNINLFTAGSATLGFYTSGTLLFGNNSSAPLASSTLLFTHGTLVLGNTTPAINLTTGGVLVANGGVIIDSNLIVAGGIDANGQNIKNVADPVKPFDAVNKEYVDYFLGIGAGDIREIGFTLGNSVTSPSMIPGFFFDSTSVSSFEALVYLRNSEIGVYTQFELNGIYRDYDFTWQMSTRLVGNYNSGVTFYISDNGQINYTNTGNAGLSIIYFRALTTGYGVFSDLNLGNYTSGTNFLGYYTSGTLLFGDGATKPLSSSDLVFTHGTLILGNTTPAVNGSTGAALVAEGGVIIKSNLIVNNGINVSNQNITNVADPIQPLDAVNKEYLDYFLGINNGDLREMGFTLGNAVITPAPVTDFKFENAITSSFEALVYLKNDTLDIYTQFELNGVYRSLDLTWQMSTRIIGDYSSGVVFSIDPTGQIYYTNSQVSGESIIYFRAFTTGYGQFTNVTLGNYTQTLGFYTSGTLLFGNGQQRPDASSNLLFTNGSLILSNKEIRLSKDDIFAEQLFEAANDQILPANIPGFSFTNSSYFSAMVSVKILTNTGTINSGFDIKGIYLDTHWQINCGYIGEYTGIQFMITDSGQMQYISTSIPDWQSTTMRFRALTTSAN